MTVLIVFGNKTQSIRARAPVLSSLSSFGASTYLAAYTLSYSIPNVPCQLIVLVANASFYMLFAPLLVRTWRIYFIYHWNSRMLKQQKKQEEQLKQFKENKKKRLAKRQVKTQVVTKQQMGETVVEMKDVDIAQVGRTNSQHGEMNVQHGSTPKNWRDVDLQTDQMSTVDVEDVPTLIDAEEVSEMIRNRTSRSKNNVYKRRAEESNLVKFFAVMLVVVVVLLVPVSLAYPKLCPHDFLCGINERETNNPIMTYILYPRLVVPALFVVDIMLLVEVIMLRDVNDSYSLNTEIRIATVIIFVATVFMSVLSFTNLSFAFIVMTYIWVQAIHTVCLYYPIFLLIYSAIRKNSMTVDLGNTEIPSNIDKMLENDITRELFKKHLVKALCSETILFYEEVMSFRKASVEDRSQIAPNIIENYIKDDALNEINIAGKIKKRIIQRYNQTSYDDEVPADLFDIAIEKLKLVLNENGTYQNFLESTEFKNFVKKAKSSKKIKEIEQAGGVV